MRTLFNAVRVYLSQACTQREQGVTVVEYAIMLALIAIAVAIGAPNIQQSVVDVFGQAIDAMDGL